MAKCVFCNLKTEYLYEDKTFVCFKDKYPASDTHLLLIPREHIRDAKHLTKSDIPMIQKMIAIGEQLAQERGLKDWSMGFHFPPFVSINHLHMHIIAKPYYNWIGALKFPQGYWYYVSPEQLISKLER